MMVSPFDLPRSPGFAGPHFDEPWHEPPSYDWIIAMAIVFIGAILMVSY